LASVGDAIPASPATGGPVLSVNSYTGLCTVCGDTGRFDGSIEDPRDQFACGRCGATLRYRQQADLLLELYSRAASTSIAQLVTEPDFRELRIYEPGVIGPFRGFLSELPGYEQSYYWPGVDPGERVRGIRCEDLERLTYPDESFDLVITSDIFEHVRRPWPAFAEIRRVLRPGACHLLAVPFSPRIGCRARVDVTEWGDLHLIRPNYHGSPTDPDGSLVFTDFGNDLPQRLQSLGYQVDVRNFFDQTFGFACRRDGVSR
jgi:SAM-dependent methyltransferase